MTISSDRMKIGDEAYIFSLTDKIYSDVSEQLEQQLFLAIDNGAKYIVLDCTRLDQIDSSGLSAIIVAIKKITKERQGEILSFGQNPSIMTVFELTKLDRFVHNFNDLEEAERFIKVKLLKGI